MTAVNLLPGAAITEPVDRVRPKPILRPRKPLTQRELRLVFARVKRRILKGGDAFGLFAIKRGHGREFRLISVKHDDYQAQLRVNRALQHMVGTYDGSADLAHVWDDLVDFDRVV